MAFENNDVEPEVEEAGPPPEESSNRPFLIVAGILGGLMLLSLLCVAAYAFLILPQRREQRANTQATQIALTTQQANVLKMTQLALTVQAYTPTPLPATPTSAPTNTPVVAVFTAIKPAPVGPDPRTATVSALLTQIAASTKAPLTPTSTALPTGGIADDLGIPGLAGVAVVLVAVIFLARRIRTAPK